MRTQLPFDIDDGGKGMKELVEINHGGGARFRGTTLKGGRAGRRWNWGFDVQ